MARTKRFMALPQPIAIVSTGQSRSFVAKNSRLPVKEMPLVGKSIQWPSVMASVNAHFEMLHWAKLIGS